MLGKRAICHNGVMSVRQHKPVMEPTRIIAAHFIEIEAGRDIGQRHPLPGIAAALHADIQHIASDPGGHQFKRGDPAV